MQQIFVKMELDYFKLDVEKEKPEIISCCSKHCGQNLNRKKKYREKDFVIINIIFSSFIE